MRYTITLIRPKQCYNPTSWVNSIICYPFLSPHFVTIIHFVINKDTIFLSFIWSSNFLSEMDFSQFLIFPFRSKAARIICHVRHIYTSTKNSNRSTLRKVFIFGKYERNNFYFSLAFCFRLSDLLSFSTFSQNDRYGWNFYCRSF